MMDIYFKRNQLTDLEMAFIAGFMASAEGFNGEYPYTDHEIPFDQFWEDLEPVFKRFIKNEILKDHANN